VDDALILFVDDKPFNADLFVRVLRRCGYTNELVRVGDGVEALDFLFGKEDHAGRDVGVKPRLILLDLNMPRMGGLETLRRLRADERIADSNADSDRQFRGQGGSLPPGHQWLRRQVVECAVP
jgi:CheY-like chemotaxis protein